MDYDALAKKFGEVATPDYDALAAKFGAVQPIDSNPASGTSTWQQILAGAGGRLSDRVRAVGERLGFVAPSDIDQSRAQDAPLYHPSETTPPIEGGKLGVRKMDRPNRTTFSPGSAGGAIADTILGASAAALAPWLNTVAGGATLGGAFGLTTPTGTGESVLPNVLTSAAVGGGANAVAKLAPGAATAVVQPLFKSGRERLAGDVLREHGVPATMPVVSGETPGWQPTLAEAVGKPSVSIMQRGLHSIEGTEGSVADAVTRRGIENNSAAIDALRKLAGTPEQRSMDAAARDYMAKPLYDQAAADGIDQGMAAAMKPQIKNLMDRPSMKVAATVAKNIFGEESITLARNGDVKGLQYMKQALDDIIEKAGSPASSIGKNQLAALQQTRSDLISTMYDLAPKQRQADQHWATFSRPINESAVALEMEKKLVPALQLGKDNPARLTASRFADTLNNLDEKIPDLTGFQGSTVKNTMSPGGMKTLEGIFSDLQRRENLSLGRGEGSNTAQNLSTQGIIKRTLGPVGLGGADLVAKSAIGRTLGRVADIIYKIPDKEIQAELAKAVLDPQYAAQLVAKANTPLLNGKAKMAGQILQLMAAPTALGVANAQKQ